MFEGEIYSRDLRNQQAMFYFRGVPVMKTATAATECKMPFSGVSFWLSASEGSPDCKVALTFVLCERDLSGKNPPLIA